MTAPAAAPAPRRWIVLLPDGQPWELRSGVPAASECREDVDQVAGLIGGRVVDEAEWLAGRIAPAAGARS